MQHWPPPTDLGLIVAGAGGGGEGGEGHGGGRHAEVVLVAIVSLSLVLARGVMGGGREGRVVCRSRTLWEGGREGGREGGTDNEMKEGGRK